MEQDDPPETGVPQPDQGPAGPALPKDLQSQLGHRLKAHYDTLLGEPVPDRFKELLGLLEGREKDDGPRARKGASGE